MAMLPNAKNPLITGCTLNAAQGDIHTHSYFTSEGRKGLDLLTNSIAPGAFHNSSERYDPPKCHPSTRVTILQHIMTWINDLQKLCFFMWLYGPAGAGKSAIAQSIAELCYDANILAASFFFSRTAVGRNDESCLIPTLVYQLCLSMPAIRKHVEDTIERDPLVLSRSLEAQIRSLVVDPIRRALLNEKDAIALRSGPKLVIIDGLDECGTAKVQRYIISALATTIQEIPLPISFLVASRPEQIIRDAFNGESLSSMTRYLALDDSYRPDEDIKLFFQSKFDEIKRNHPLRNHLPPEWPSASELVRLVQKSSGQFIYACTVMKYLDSPDDWPTDRLDIIFGLSNPGVDTPFAELDALYIHIFSKVRNITRALEILSLLLLTPVVRPITPQLLEDLFFLRHGDVYIILNALHSIMDVPVPSTDIVSPTIRIYHASLGDFLLDKSRSAKLYIDAGSAHANLTQYFLKHLSNTDHHTSQDDGFFTVAFINHCPLSYPTPELLDDLSRFDFYRFLTILDSPIRIRYIPYLFDWLKEHSHNNSPGKNLYSRYLFSWDQYLKSNQLAPLMISSNLAPLVVAAMMLPTFPRHFHPLMKCLGSGLNDHSFDEFSGACSSIFPTAWFMDSKEPRKYHNLLSEFLGDPIRSKEFYIDGNKFATLATALAGILFGPTLRVMTPHEENTPDTWRYLTQDEFLACAFSCLPDCLERASPSKDLVLFLQNHQIPSIWQHDLFVDHSSEANFAAINAYILRCNVSEVPDIKLEQSNGTDGLECMTGVVSTDDPTSDHPNPVIEARNSSITQSRTEHETNDGWCFCDIEGNS
ncbi:hypothetical protein BYT27DRAFT_7174195 [Phlegmacium glaucopus]|nr:hypothetical protein BYT27DRAFT_7174195 [Phlegmacium glaucopus]